MHCPSLIRIRITSFAASTLHPKLLLLLSVGGNIGTRLICFTQGLLGICSTSVTPDSMEKGGTNSQEAGKTCIGGLACVWLSKDEGPQKALIHVQCPPVLA
ncbi:hypothetical protein GDO81_019475 [Engystomops pustulosus]|uniref:Uncharacterized protein n=1 Tax=Engystomops pustulosus TaxID=76066 RepID=A0AAV6YYY2_ENGPU|nr:hypothetical protein GDO81_019475 [Engystomops pustulosus]